MNLFVGQELIGVWSDQIFVIPMHQRLKNLIGESILCQCARESKMSSMIGNDGFSMPFCTLYWDSLSFLMQITGVHRPKTMHQESEKGVGIRHLIEPIHCIRDDATARREREDHAT